MNKSNLGIATANKTKCKKRIKNYNTMTFKVNLAVFCRQSYK